MTGQYYLRARYYNPVIGRFTQEDTYYGDGLNLYAYCANNPVGYYDPSGTICDQKIHDMFMDKKGMTDKQAWEAAHEYQAARARGKTAAEAYKAATGSNPMKPGNKIPRTKKTPRNNKNKPVGMNDPQKYGTPHKALSKEQRRAIQDKINNGTATRQEYERYQWDRRFTNRRNRGVQRFWSEERKRLQQGKEGTRNWTESQKQDILNGKTPTFDGEAIEGHHMYNAADYPQIADNPANIYPATNSEHFERWHGGNYQNDTSGVPNNPGFEEEF